MAFLANREEIAYFTIAVDLMTRVVVISDITSFVVQPRASADPRGRPELVAQACRIVALICAVIICILILAARPLVFVLFSPAFAPVIPLMSIIGLGVAVRCAGKGLVTFLEGTNRPGVFSVATVISTLVNVALLIVLFPSLRMAGAAWALTCSYFASTIILMGAFRIFSGMSLPQTWMVRKADFQLLASFIRQARQTLRSVSIVRRRSEDTAAGSVGKEPHDARSEKTSTSP